MFSPRGVMHKHSFIPVKRLNRAVIKECPCGQRKTDLIKDFSKEKAEIIDIYLEKLKETDAST
jgi:hypothetical protein